MRVLAADDDDALLRVLDRNLRSWGYETLTAANGFDAWRVLKREDAPPIAILDWDMPGMTGVEVCRLLRSTAHGAGCYVLMLTARDAKDDLVDALEAGVDDFLSKPFHARELQLRLAKGVAAREKARGDRREATPPPTGTTLGGKYRLERKIAEGGMATVWEGVHLSLGIDVAIKFVKADIAERTDFASFEKEARSAAQLRSEHVVRVYDHGISQEGLPYLVMELLRGESLASRIDSRGPLTFEEVAALVEQVGRALSEAHAHGIVHRDVKPENILLTDTPDRAPGFSAKLVDFGLANPMAAPVATSGVVAGTPSYMSPEYLEGEAPASPALDLWGLAATTFAAITGVGPFDAPTFGAIYEQVCMDPLPIPSDCNSAVSSRFDEWFSKACHRDPRKRFQTVAAFTSALLDACERSVPSAAMPSATRRASVFAKTEPDSVRIPAVPSSVQVLVGDSNEMKRARRD